MPISWLTAFQTQEKSEMEIPPSMTRAEGRERPEAQRTMTAFVMEGVGKTGFVNKPMPMPGPSGAIVRTTRALVCSFDHFIVEGGLGERKNVTLGHEAAGVVHAVGWEVKNLKRGDRVVVSAVTPCYHCDACLSGNASQCSGMLGGWKFENAEDGVFAEYFVVNDAEANLARIPDSVSDEAAAYVSDVMNTGFMGAEHANIPLGGRVAVFGGGPVGLMAAWGAQLLGAGHVTVVETVPKRQQIAEYLAVDAVVDFTLEDPVDEIFRITDGRGVDSAIEASGSRKAFEGCVRSTRPGGTISVIGCYRSRGEDDSIHIPRDAWGSGMSDKTIRTGLCPGGKERMERLLRLIETGRVDPTILTTHRVPFGQLDKAFKFRNPWEEGVIKTLVLFDASSSRK